MNGHLRLYQPGEEDKKYNFLSQTVSMKNNVGKYNVMLTIQIQIQIQIQRDGGDRDKHR